MSKFYAYFNNTQELGVLVLELLGISLGTYVDRFMGETHPKVLTSVAVQATRLQL